MLCNYNKSRQANPSKKLNRRHSMFTLIKKRFARKLSVREWIWLCRVLSMCVNVDIELTLSPRHMLGIFKFHAVGYEPSGGAISHQTLRAPEGESDQIDNLTAIDTGSWRQFCFRYKYIRS